MEYEKIQLKQPMIALLSGVTISTVHRKITEEKIVEVNENSDAQKKFAISEIRKLTSFFLRKPDSLIAKKIHTFYNFKGGTGKTSMAFHVSTHLSLMGFNVLTIDLDPQAHLSMSLGFDEAHRCPTMYNVFQDEVSIEEAVQNVSPGLDVIPSNLLLTKVETSLIQRARREEVLKRYIDKIKGNYDFIIIDTNPTISTLNINALTASDHINIVCETHPYSLSGLGILIEELESLSKDIGKSFSYTIIPNKYESKTATAQEVLGALRVDYKGLLTKTVVRKCEDFNLSTKYKLPICAFAKRASPAFEDLVDLIHEIIEFSTNKTLIPFDEEKNSKVA